jgi:hypothetical protein
MGRPAYTLWHSYSMPYTSLDRARKLRVAEGGKSSRTRLKELKRIEAAIEHKNKADLQWALGYCKMRLQIAFRKDHQKHWHQLENKVRQALDSK